MEYEKVPNPRVLLLLSLRYGDGCVLPPLTTTFSVFSFHEHLLFIFWFLVKKDAPGLTATEIENKIGLRIVQNGDIVVKKVFVPNDDRLPGVNSFQDTNKLTYF